MGPELKEFQERAEGGGGAEGRSQFREIGLSPPPHETLIQLEIQIQIQMIWNVFVGPTRREIRTLHRNEHKANCNSSTPWKINSFRNELARRRRSFVSFSQGSNINNSSAFTRSQGRKYLYGKW